MNTDFILLPFVEVEIRLGTVNNTHFDSSVDMNYFKSINSALEKGEWKSTEKIFTKEYYKKDEKSRLIEHFSLSENDEIKIKDRSLIIKENVLTNTIQLKNSPFDIRFSVNQEFMLNSYIENNLNSFTDDTTTIREKLRHSFINDDFKYDLTYVVQTKNNIKKEKYEIEIEILQIDTTISWDTSYLNDFIECKIYDLDNIIEKIDKEQFKIKLF
jgi:hypothetical protein